MRKLGNGHTVMFFAPLEVNQSIRSVTHKEDRNIRITAADVLKWAIHETWTDIRQQVPYWAQQDMNHKKKIRMEQLLQRRDYARPASGCMASVGRQVTR